MRVELISESAGIEPGGHVWVGLRKRIAPGWHTYWINPGDSGEPATIEWTLPAGFEASDIVWPHPERIPVDPAMSFGYSNEVVLLARISAPRDVAPGSRAHLRAQVSWLVCEKICIPEEARVELSLPVVAGAPPPDPRGAPLIAEARRAVPGPSPWPASFSAKPGASSSRSARAASTAIASPTCGSFPRNGAPIEHAAPQEVAVRDDGMTIRLARGPLPDALAGSLEGVLVVTERLDGRTARHAFTIKAAPSGALGSPGSGATAAASGPRGISLLEAVALALAGGIALNLMPCVLPVLSVKVLALVEHAGLERPALRRHGLAYAAGVLSSFSIVAGALLALRAGGEQIGWGFQLQSPLFVTLLAYVLFALALSLSGVVVIGGSLAGAGHSLASRPGYAGSFFTGALATVAATPCTAPFMGAATGFAVTQPWTTALVVFVALGLGLALPFLVLTLVPAWRRLLPRPGPWMERLKQLLAFPLYASAGWLVWVVSQQAGPQGVAVALAGLLLIGFGAWLYEASRNARPRVAASCRGHRRPGHRRGGRARRRVGRRAAGIGAGGGERFGRDVVRGIQPSTARRAAQPGRAGLRQLHGGMVHHLPGQRAGGAALAGGGRGLRAQGRGVPQGGLDQPRSRDRRRARVVRAQRRAPLRALSSRGCGSGGAHAAPSDPERGDDHRGHRQAVTPVTSTSGHLVSVRGGTMRHDNQPRRRFIADAGLMALAASGGIVLPRLAWASAKVGEAAPPFTAATTAGPSVSLSDYRGKIVVLEWTNHDCPYVRKHYDTSNMQALQKETTGQGVIWLTVISSAPGTQGFVSPAEANELTSTRKAAPTAVVLDPKGTVGKMYGATNTPHMYIVDKGGAPRLRGRH